MTIDPRLAERRRRVLEDRARGGVRRVIQLMVLVAVAGAGLWLVQSPWLSVAAIDVSGQSRADVEAALTAAGIEVGRPLLFSPVGEARERLLADPWVADAAVDRLFPDTIEVRLIERDPAAAVGAGGQAIVVSSDGVALARGEVDGLPVIRLRVAVPELGERFDDDRVAGAASFLTALSPTYQRSAVVFEAEGELWAEVGDWVVRLGRPVEMSQKAAALEAVLGEGQPAGAIINVIAPTRPTVRLGGGPSADAEPSTDG